MASSLSPCISIESRRAKSHRPPYPEIVRETVNTLHVDGHKGFGHYMSRQAMDLGE